jgi:hypothetical protein
MIRNIPTRYKKVLYRSRLEARWAVFFDELGIKHIYEHEGFNLANGEYYLPDFYLPYYGIYCEVKPTLSELELNKSTFVNFTKTSNWLLMLVGIPNVNTTILFQKHDSILVVPFVNLIKENYGNYWSSPYDFGSNQDRFKEYNLFKNAIEVAEKYNFY